MATQLNKKNDVKVLRAVRLQDLKKSKSYEITMWKLVKTQSTGERVLVHLEGEYKTLLPQRYNEDTESVLKEMKTKKLFMRYDGMKELSNGYKMHQLFFK